MCLAIFMPYTVCVLNNEQHECDVIWNGRVDEEQDVKIAGSLLLWRNSTPGRTLFFTICMSGMRSMACPVIMAS